MAAPEFPLLEDPELNSNAPLTPAAPEFALLKINTPLLEDVPSPLERFMAPPVFIVLRPASN
jgi:hypothetical protein